jgi:hypothetical protein
LRERTGKWRAGARSRIPAPAGAEQDFGESLRYIARLAGAAEWSTPVAIEEDGWYPAIVVDPAGTLWVVHRHSTSELKHLDLWWKPASGGWQSGIVPDGASPYGMDLHLSASGVLHTSYRFGAFALHHAERRGDGTWSTSTVDPSAGASDYRTSVTTTPDGTVLHVLDASARRVRQVRIVPPPPPPADSEAP